MNLSSKFELNCKRRVYSPSNWLVVDVDADDDGEGEIVVKWWDDFERKKSFESIEQQWLQNNDDDFCCFYTIDLNWKGKKRSALGDEKSLRKVVKNRYD
jgi:hypothetical protein